MNFRSIRLALGAVVAIAGIAAPAAYAAEISLLSGGAVEPGLKPALAAFEAATGHVVRVTFRPAGRVASSAAQMMFDRAGIDPAP
mgnify:CR=1 FL=1